MQPAYIDAVAMVIGSSMRISILNRHPSADWSAKLVFADYEPRSVAVYELYSDDLAAVNTFEKPDTIVPEKKTYDADAWAKEGLIVKKHSWMFLMFDGEQV